MVLVWSAGSLYLSLENVGIDFVSRFCCRGWSVSAVGNLLPINDSHEPIEFSILLLWKSTVSAYQSLSIAIVKNLSFQRIYKFYGPPSANNHNLQNGVSVFVWEQPGSKTKSRIKLKFLIWCICMPPRIQQLFHQNPSTGCATHALLNSIYEYKI